MGAGIWIDRDRGEKKERPVIFWREKGISLQWFHSLYSRALYVGWASVGHDIAASKMKPSQSYYMESLFRERKRLHIDPSKEEKAAYMQGDEEEMPGMKPC